MLKDSTVQLQVKLSATALGTNIRRCHDTLYELRRLSQMLFSHTRADGKEIRAWFQKEGFGKDKDGFWQSIPLVSAFRENRAPSHAVSYSWHPDLVTNPDACFRMFCLRNIGRLLEEIRSGLPGTAWIYYQDITNTALQFPFIDQVTAIPPDFDWHTYHTFRSVVPENNPSGGIQWTRPTIDYAGEGLIVSASIPVTLDRAFIGLWSIDLPMESLYRDLILDTFFPDQVNLIMDRDGNLVAHPDIQTRVDKEKGSIFHQHVHSLDTRFTRLDPGAMAKQGSGRLALEAPEGAEPDLPGLVAWFETVPGIDWIFMATFPRRSMADAVNQQLRQALDRVKSGDFSYRLHENDGIDRARVLAEGFNEMATALERQEKMRQTARREKEKLEKQIQQFQKMEAIGTLAGGIAHDFNNILFPIMGYAELLLQDIPETDPSHKMLDQIYGAAVRARDLIGQILTFSRQTKTAFGSVLWQPIVKESLKLLRSSIPKDIDILSQISPDCRPVFADPTLLHQVVMNLCTNAFHAVESPGGKFEVSLDQVELEAQAFGDANGLLPGIYARLTVSDNGCGMDEETRMQIFNPYFTTKEEGKGTGLGLSVTYGIVHKLNGDIRVYSEPGQGATFQVYLPCADAPASFRAREEMEVPGGRERILLVDDEQSIARMGQGILERYGYEVRAFTQSPEALAAFEQAPQAFDLVVTDMTMPEMTGDVLARRIKAVRPDIPVILCTGFSEKLSSTQSRAGAVDRFLMKPVAIREFARSVRALLDDNLLVQGRP